MVDSGDYGDLETRCAGCMRFAYVCGKSGEDSISGWMCGYCVRLHDWWYGREYRCEVREWERARSEAREN